MNRLLFIFIIPLFVSSGVLANEVDCRFQMVDDIPQDYNELPTTYKTKIIAYVDKDGPVQKATKGKCGKKEYTCNVGATLSKCRPCAASDAYGMKYPQITDRYVALCMSGKSNILETVFNEFFSTSADSTEPQAMEPESISAPIFNGAKPTALSIEEQINLASDETKTKIQNLLSYADNAIKEIKQECANKSNSSLEKCKNQDDTIYYIKRYTKEKIQEIL